MSEERAAWELPCGIVLQSRSISVSQPNRISVLQHARATMCFSSSTHKRSCYSMLRLRGRRSTLAGGYSLADGLTLPSRMLAAAFPVSSPARNIATAPLAFFAQSATNWPGARERTTSGGAGLPAWRRPLILAPRAWRK